MSLRNDDQSAATDAVPRADGGASIRLRDVEKAETVSRRGVLWKAGLATAGAVGALSMLDDRRAEAATGGNFILGQSNQASSTTELTHTNGASMNPLMQLTGTGMNATTSSLLAIGPAGGAAIVAQGFSTNATIATIGLAIKGSGDGASNGVFGGSGSGYGVTGNSSSGTGVHGISNTGTGVIAESSNGTALTVNGKTQFSRSGVNNIPSGTATKVVNVTGMTASSGVIATLQSFKTGLHIVAAVPSSGKFTLHLNQATTAQMKFAWFAVIG